MENGSWPTGREGPSTGGFAYDSEHAARFGLLVRCEADLDHQNGPSIEACIADARRATSGSPDPLAFRSELPNISCAGINKPAVIALGGAEQIQRGIKPRSPRADYRIRNPMPSNIQGKELNHIVWCWRNKHSLRLND